MVACLVDASDTDRLPSRSTCIKWTEWPLYRLSTPAPSPCPTLPLPALASTPCSYRCSLTCIMLTSLACSLSDRMALPAERLTIILHLLPLGSCRSDSHSYSSFMRSWERLWTKNLMLAFSWWSVAGRGWTSKAAQTAKVPLTATPEGVMFLLSRLSSFALCLSRLSFTLCWTSSTVSHR